MFNYQRVVSQVILSQIMESSCTDNAFVGCVFFAYPASVKLVRSQLRSSVIRPIPPVGDTTNRDPKIIYIIDPMLKQ